MELLWYYSVFFVVLAHGQNQKNKSCLGVGFEWGVFFFDFGKGLCLAKIKQKVVRELRKAYV